MLEKIKNFIKSFFIKEEIKVEDIKITPKKKVGRPKKKGNV